MNENIPRGIRNNNPGNIRNNPNNRWVGLSLVKMIRTFVFLYQQNME